MTDTEQAETDTRLYDAGRRLRAAYPLTERATGATNTTLLLGHVGKPSDEPTTAAEAFQDSQSGPVWIDGPPTTETGKASEWVSEANIERVFAALNRPGVLHAHVLRGVLPLSEGELRHLLGDRAQAETPKPTGRARLCWQWPGGVDVQREAWESFGSSRVRGESLPSRVERWWLEYEYTATTPEAEKPGEAPSLPQPALSAHEVGKLSGGAENAAETGEIRNVSFRMIDHKPFSRVTATIHGKEFTFDAPDMVAVALLEASKSIREVPPC
jgi:hypothetical protein